MADPLAEIDRLLRRMEGLERSLGERQKQLGQLVELLAELQSHVEPGGSLSKEMTRLQWGIEAILRKVYLRPEELEAPARLVAGRFKLLSQFEEDGITLAILREAGITNARFVELGCGDNGGNSGFLAKELGWSGLMVDAERDCVAAARLRFNSARVQVVQSWITREEIDDLLERHGVTGEIDLLGIDIDGNDYWVWEAISVVSPRVVIIEYNALFGPDRAVAVPYDPKFTRPRRQRAYFGASLRALSQLGERQGYRLVAVEPHGANAFFLRDDLAPAIPASDPAEAFRPGWRPVWDQAFPTSPKRARKIHERRARLSAYMKRKHLPLVDLSGDGDRREDAADDE